MREPADAERIERFLAELDRDAFARSAPDLYRYPAIDPATYRDVLESALQD